MNEVVDSMHGMNGTDSSMHHNTNTTMMMHHNGTDGMHGMVGNHGMVGMHGTDGNGMQHGMGGMGGAHDVHNVDHAGTHPLYFSFELPLRILFFEWNITTQGQLAGSCIGVFFLAILYEGLKVLRQYLLRRAKHRLLGSRNGSDQEVDFKMAKDSAICRVFNGWHLLQSLLHIIQITHGMFLMLIYMTFNIWLAFSVSLGAGVGYFMFAWSAPTDPDFGDHCQ